jgi:hypothetical protein
MIEPDITSRWKNTHVKQSPTSHDIVCYNPIRCSVAWALTADWSVGTVYLSLEISLTDYCHIFKKYSLSGEPVENELVRNRGGRTD